MTRPKITRVIVVALGLTLALATAALAADQPAADGELTGDVLSSADGNVNEARAFGDLCPGHTYGDTGSPNVALGIFQTALPVTGSYKVGTSVTFDTQTAIGAQIPSGPLGPVAPVAQDPKDGSPSAAIEGSNSFTVPVGWNTSRAIGRTAGSVNGRITLVVGPNATPNETTTDDGTDDAWNGTALWRAAGTKHTTNVLTGPTVASLDNRNEIITWRVLDGDASACDRAATATAAFTTSHVACGGTAILRVTPTDPDAAITSEDGLDLDVQWGDGVPDSADVHVTGIKGNTPIDLAAPYSDAGTHTATVTWTDGRSDAAAFTGSTTASVAIDYNTSGILQPVNADGSSIFKSVSTIPLKLRFTGCDGSVPSDLPPTISVVKIGGSTPPTGTEETALSTSAHTDGVMRFSEGQWIYNLSGKSLADPSGTYRLTIRVPATGQTVQVTFGLKA